MMTLLGALGTLAVVLLLIVLAVLLIAGVSMVVLLALAASLTRWKGWWNRLTRRDPTAGEAEPEPDTAKGDAEPDATREAEPEPETTAGGAEREPGTRPGGETTPAGLRMELSGARASRS
ncbi:hypothetical protein [Nonomuraea fuscirosea]|uniref:hypothetical protein n=1 Tax=Nonomuraea fuscirosea TaxID=1291556 RepID=UPI00343EFD1D